MSHNELRIHISSNDMTTIKVEVTAVFALSKFSKTYLVYLVATRTVCCRYNQSTEHKFGTPVPLAAAVAAAAVKRRLLSFLLFCLDSAGKATEALIEWRRRRPKNKLLIIF